MTVSLETLKKSVGKKNSNSKIFAWLADLERAAGDLDTALNRIDGGLTLYANDVAALIVRAKILFQKEDFEGCVQQCEKILVKDPFSLAAQKIMGDAYDKLGDEAHRNLCYRRYHDMDPLNNFWKDEYDVVVDVAATAAALSDDAFSMPSDDESLDMNLGGDDIFDKSVEEPVAEDSPFEKSNDSFDLSLDDSTEVAAPAEENSASAPSPFGGFSLNEPEEEVAAVEDDPFAALAAMLPNSDSADDSAIEDLSASLDSVMQAIESGEPAAAEEFPVDDNISGNDVNSALADMFGLDDDLEAEEVSSAPAEQIVLDEEAEANASSIFGSPKPVDEDKPMSVDNAFDSIFGEDELPEEIEPAVAVPAAETAEPAANKSVDEDKPTTVNNAFDDIFGEDELPEERPQPAASEWSPVPAVEESENVAEESVNASDDSLGLEEESLGGGLFEKSASADMSSVEEDKPTTVDNAFDDIFGEDELPEEKPQEKSSAEAVFGSGLFEKSAGSNIFENSFAEASDVLSLDEPTAEETLELPAEESLELPAEETLELPAEDSLELPAEETQELPAEESHELPAEETLEQPVEEKSSEVADAFGSIFGDDDDLPEEKPQSAAGEWSVDAALAAEIAAPETEADAEESLELPAEDNQELPSEGVAQPADDSLELPAEENLELSADESLELPAEEKSSEVADAFGSIFGDDDDLPEENVAPVAEVETPVDPVIASPMDFVFDDDSSTAKSEDAAEETPAGESSVAVDSAFASIFGDDDDLPVEGPAPVAEEPVDERTLAEKVDSAETELELPAAEEKPEAEDLAKEMGGAFASMFGNDDELDLPETKASSESDQESTGAAIEEVAATVGSEDAKSDLDKSFDDLFGDDDSLDLSGESAKDESSKAAPADLNSLETEVSGAFKGLFDMEDDTLDESKPSNKGVDFLMSGDSDDEVSASLINNPDAPLDRGAHELDESLNTRTLAEIYFDQGLYGKAIDIYADLVQKEPENEEIRSRLAEIEKVYRTKFGGEA